MARPASPRPSQAHLKTLPSQHQLRTRVPSCPPHHPLPDALALASGFRRIIGVDEAGRGPWAGPVVAGAVLLPTRYLTRGLRAASHLLGTRLDDSKRLSPSQRLRAYRVLLQHARVGVGIVPSDIIDRRNILNATWLAMQQAVEDVGDPADLILVDGAQAPAFSTSCWPIVAGDQRSVAIASASIVAKVVRDSLMQFYHRLFPVYRFDQHKGYGTSRHRQALTHYGPTLLHRMSFEPVRLAATVRQAFQVAASPTTQDDANTLHRVAVAATTA